MGSGGGIRIFQVAIAATVLTTGAAQAETRRDLGSALTQLGVLYDVQILFEPKLVKGQVAGPLMRGVPVETALTNMLAAQNLVFRRVAHRTYALSPRPVGPVPTPARAVVQAPVLAPTVAEAVVVTAIHAGALARALSVKRQAGFSLDVVTAEEIGRLPAENAAEALQSVPGISLERFRGVGLYVSARGLGPQFQNVLLNGRPLAINDLVENGGFRGRQFRFEVLPADVIDRIDVIKTPTADMGEGALGGNIDVHTFKPLDLGRRGALSLRAGHGDGGGVDPSASGLISWTDPSGRLGLLAAGLVEQRRIRNDRLYQVGWNLDRFKSALPLGLYTPSRTRPTIELEDRRLTSGDFAVQWRPDAGLSLDADLLVTRLDADYDERGLDIYPDDTTFATPSFVAGSQTIKDATVQAGTINNVRWMASRETSLNRHDLIAAGLHGRWNRGRWRIDADYAWSLARSYHPDGRGTVRARAAFFGPLIYDVSAGYRAARTLRTTIDYNDPANFVGQAFDYTRKDSRDRDEVFKLDAVRAFARDETRLSFGVEQQRRVRDYRRRDIVLDTLLNVPIVTLEPKLYGPASGPSFMPSLPGDLPRRWVLLDAQAFYDRLYTAEVAARPPSTADLRNSFVLEEKIASAYGRLEYGASLAGAPVRGDIGVRLARTDQLSQGVLADGPDPLPARWSKRYDNVLPSANLRLELAPDLIVRLAASRVVNRPNVTDNAPRITVSRDTPTANGGNPDLGPFMATQLDAAVEWYFDRGGALTAAVFERRLDDYITAQNKIIQVPGRGAVLLSTNVNGGKARISGLELAYSQVFRGLPEPLDGLGLQVAATAVRSEATYYAGDRVIRDALVGLSSETYSLIGFYEQGRLSTRLGYFWRAPYLTSIGSSILAPSYTDAFGSLDGAASWRVNDRATLSIEGVNLADARKYIYGETKDQPMEIHRWGRHVSVKMHWAF